MVGMRPVVVGLPLDGAPAHDAARLDAALGSDLDETQVAGLRRIIDESGAHAQVESVITELAARATTALRAAEVDEQARGVLLELAAAATDRLH
jgi:geranylgeranyl diphosphate synthase type I